MSETNNSMLVKLDITRIFLRILRISVYILGVICIIFYYIDIISLIIGALYFGFFKDEWRKHGFLLALAAAISALLPQRGVADITGIYPLYLVLLVGWGMICVYFLIYIIFKIIRKYDLLKERRTSFHQRVNFQRFPQKYTPFVLIILILIPIGIWVNVNVNLAVILDNNPKLLWINAPSTVNESSQFEFIVEAWDRFERLSAVYKGFIDFSLESYNLTTFNPLPSVDAELPSTYTFTGQLIPSDMAYSIQDGRDNGLHMFQMTIDTPGIHYILVTDSVTKNTYYSNPIIVENTAENIYWGDIHSHSFLSDGSGSVTHTYYYARYVAGLEFHALTDHGEIIPFVVEGLSNYEKATDIAYEPNKFVTFRGIEYTNHETGHFSCIFDGDQMVGDISTYTCSTPYDLWETLDDFTTNTGARVLALPHHCVKKRYMQDWSYMNSNYVKIAEVTSVHGDSLYEPSHPLSYRGSTVPPPKGTMGCSIIDAMKMGHRLSLYASSDEHDGHPGHSISHTAAHVCHQNPWTTWWTRMDKPYPSGLTAVYANRLTRNAIFSSLEERKIFANSDHGRPILKFSINDVTVGDSDSVLTVQNNTSPRKIDVFLAQDGAPASTKRSAASVFPNWIPSWKAVVEIIKNGELLAQFDITNPTSLSTFEDSSSITGATYGRENCIQVGTDYYLNKFSDNPIDNPDDLNTGGVDFYLVRIIGENGRHSYIGPIWVKVP